MKLKSSNKVEVNRYELEIEITPEEFSKEVDKVFNKQKGKITIPGFRKGKAPRKFIEKYYGEEIFYEDALNSLYPYAVENAVKEAGLELVEDHIDFELVKMGKEDGVIFKVKVTVMPEVTLGDYKAIKIEKKASEDVSEKDLEDALEKVREDNARLISVESGSVEKGDVVNINFEGFVDSKAFQGGTAENVDLEIGKKQFIDGFEDQIIGHKIGEEFEINVTFPEGYHVPDLAGKEAVFKIKVNRIQKKELPVLDDEFVKDISEFETLEEYKKDLKEKQIQRNKKKAENEAEDEMINKFTELVTAEIPEALIKNKCRSFLKDFEYNLRAQGLSIKDYIHYTGSNEDALLNTYRPQALTRVKLELGLKKLAEIEKITVTPEEIEKEYEVAAKSYAMTAKQLKKLIPQEDIERELTYRKSLESLRKETLKIEG